MTDLMEKELGREEFDVLEYVGLCTLDIICGEALLHKQIKINFSES